MVVFCRVKMNSEGEHEEKKEISKRLNFGEY